MIVRTPKVVIVKSLAYATLNVLTRLSAMVGGTPYLSSSDCRKIGLLTVRILCKYHLPLACMDLSMLIHVMQGC